MLIKCGIKHFVFVYSFFQLLFAQNLEKTVYAQSIKSIVFKSQNKKVQFPIVKLGESFQLHFDDLNGDERNYYYKIKYYNHFTTFYDIYKSMLKFMIHFLLLPFRPLILFICYEIFISDIDLVP